MNNLIDFLKKSGISFEENISGARLTSFRVGGKIRVAAMPCDIVQLRSLLDYLDTNGIKNVLLGKGSNVVIDDDGYDGVAVLLSKMNSIVVEDNFIEAESGASMLVLAITAQKSGLTGLEFAHGIPGSVGGGIYMNAGAYGGEMSQVLLSCTCYDKRNKILMELDNSKCGFSYRHSIFQDNKDIIVLRARFCLENGDPCEIKKKMDELKALRISKQPLEYPSAGSTFKRPPNNFAGKLIEDAGLKGYRMGGVRVSEKHAGFIINCGDATCKDIKALVEYIKRTVYDRFEVTLECEIEFI